MANLHPFVGIRRLIVFEQIEQFCRRVCHQQHFSVLLLKKTALYCVIEKRQKVIEVTIDVKQTAGLLVKL